MADHRTLVSANVHEPKHISDSTASDAGKVITPLSGGSSELRNLTPAEVGINQYFLEWGKAENLTVLSVTAATDTELYTPSDFTKIVSTNYSGATVDEANGITFDATTYDATAPVNGIYKTEFFANVHSNVNNTKIGFKYTLNGTAASSTVKHDAASIGRVINMSSSSLVNLTAGDKVGIAIAADKTADLSIDDIKIVMILLREL